jgi:hypothetical protein
LEQALSSGDQRGVEVAEVLQRRPAPGLGEVWPSPQRLVAFIVRPESPQIVQVRRLALAATDLLDRFFSSTLPTRQGVQ